MAEWKKRLVRKDPKIGDKLWGYSPSKPTKYCLWTISDIWPDLISSQINQTDLIYWAEDELGANEEVIMIPISNEFDDFLAYCLVR